MDSIMESSKEMNCVLCSSEIESDLYNLNLSKTTKSNKPVFLVLKQVLENLENSEAYYSELCENCYLLLDELETIKIRAAAIETQLRSYVKCDIQDIVNRENTQQEDVFIITDTDGNEEDGNTPTKPTIKCEQNEKNVVQSKKSKHVNLQCEICLKKYKTKSELKSHLKSHGTAQPFVCHICGKAYKQQKALDIHIGMHKDGKTPFVCPFCDKYFTQKNALERHLPRHTGELPFQCEACGKCFKYKTSLNMHKLTHSGAKMFKCEVCGHDFFSTSHLNRHKKLHFGEKRYVCSLCGKKFLEKYNLEKHEKVHTGSNKTKQYQCQICSNSYHRLALLEKHLLNTHQLDNTRPLNNLNNSF